MLWPQGGPGWQVGCTPCCTETLRPQTKQRVRSHSGGTSPRRLPDRCASMWSFMVPMFAHPDVELRRCTGKGPGRLL